ncbi:M23 family metallopeptidase [Chryseobacterium sp. RR2-3-20]|uniref:M23 family metallopeptidase n=1 Tax=Chryseobacterium sp. RR2-3-20 TaxID=2787626 RepID=UPI001AE0D11C|nr:M23 family metallopeptidase [Chryseobacterium sp. RR2-3-20]
MQGNNGNFTHNTPYSRYAVDFDMKVGDTITCADDGFVVGVIKDYEFGKNDKNWENFSNFITVYHPQSGLFTQYAHLKKNGNFVKVGDFVKRNQPIGLSGETGYVSGAHLHFNVLIPERNKTLVSVPYILKMEFILKTSIKIRRLKIESNSMILKC